jgi:hypothetical protein
VVGKTLAPPIVVVIAFSFESSMTCISEGAAPAGNAPVILTSIVSVANTAKTLFSFIKYSPQSTQSTEFVIHNVNATCNKKWINLAGTSFRLKGNAEDENHSSARGGLLIVSPS